MRYMIYWDDLILWWPLSYFGLSMSVSILRCLSEPSFMFVTHCQERNLCYFTQKSLLVVVVVVGGGGGGIAIIESAPGPDLWDLRWRWYWDDLYMTWAWPELDLDMTWTWSGPELDSNQLLYQSNDFGFIFNFEMLKSAVNAVVSFEIVRSDIE